MLFNFLNIFMTLWSFDHRNACNNTCQYRTQDTYLEKRLYKPAKFWLDSIVMYFKQLRIT